MLENLNLRAELEAVKRIKEEYYVKMSNLEREVQLLKLELEKAGADPTYIERQKERIAATDKLIASAKISAADLEAQIKALLQQRDQHQTEAQQTKLLSTELSGILEKKMGKVIADAESASRVKNILIGLVVGVVGSVIASYLYTAINPPPPPAASSAIGQPDRAAAPAPNSPPK